MTGNLPHITAGRLLCVFSAILVASIDVASGASDVLEYTEANFDAEIGQHDLALVECVRLFYLGADICNNAESKV